MRGSSGLEFVDTNVLVYAYNFADPHKHLVAKTLLSGLWNSGKGILSIQVMQEFYVVVTQKVSNPISSETAIQIIEDLGKWGYHIPKLEDIIEAVQIQQRNKLSFWDALIICSAKKSGCNIIWTEDLNHNQVYEGLKVLNPFDSN